MQVQFNKRTITPIANRYNDKKTGQEKLSLKTTVLSPVQYSLKPTPGMMPVEQIQAVLEECAENYQEVEIEFVERQTSYGAEMQIFNSVPDSKKFFAICSVSYIYQCFQSYCERFAITRIFCYFCLYFDQCF